MPTTTTVSEKQLPQGDLLAWSCLEVFAGLIKSKPELLPVCDSANDAIFTRLMELDALMRLVWAGRHADRNLIQQAVSFVPCLTTSI